MKAKLTEEEKREQALDDEAQRHLAAWTDIANTYTRAMENERIRHQQNVDEIWRLYYKSNPSPAAHAGDATRGRDAQENAMGTGR